MLLTKKSDSTARAGSPFVHRLQRGLAQAIPTMDRRAFLRRSGLGVGVGLAASQLTLVKKSQAAGPNKGDGSGKVEVDGWSLFIQFSKKKWGASRLWHGGTHPLARLLTFSGLLQSNS